MISMAMVPCPVKEVASETKLIYSDHFSARTGNKVYLKPENMQLTGAYNQNIVHQRQFLDDLHGDGALSRSHVQIVKRMHKSIPVLCRQFIGSGTGLVVHVAVQHHLRAVTFRPVHLGIFTGDGKGAKRQAMKELSLDKFEEAYEIVKEVASETKLIYSDHFSARTGP